MGRTSYTHDETVPTTADDRLELSVKSRALPVAATGQFP